MSFTLSTREAAVQWLGEQGLYAAARDWSFGKAVIAAAGRIEPESRFGDLSDRDAEKIVAYRYMLCIHPDNGQWSVSDMSNAFLVTKTYGTLEEATHEAARDLLGRLYGEADT